MVSRKNCYSQQQQQLSEEVLLALTKCEWGDDGGGGRDSPLPKSLHRSQGNKREVGATQAMINQKEQMTLENELDNNQSCTHKPKKSGRPGVVKMWNHYVSLHTRVVRSMKCKQKTQKGKDLAPDLFSSLRHPCG
mmetsp:Transcript_25145/g.40835  ORF Transcript_25145/g.40835 Transcript_25145/m.40835 type:complete len:135 (+) Transcript_25145:636-1040(+)